MIKEIIQLLPEKQRKRGAWVAFSVLLRAILDFAGVAALIPILLVVVKQDGGRGMMLALCGAVLLFVLLKNALVVFLHVHKVVTSWRYTGNSADGCLPIITIADCFS